MREEAKVPNEESLSQEEAHAAYLALLRGRKKFLGIQMKSFLREEEKLVHLFGYLDLATLARAATVNKRWRHIASNKGLAEQAILGGGVSPRCRGKVWVALAGVSSYNSHGVLEEIKQKIQKRHEEKGMSESAIGELPSPMALSPTTSLPGPEAEGPCQLDHNTPMKRSSSSAKNSPPSKGKSQPSPNQSDSPRGSPKDARKLEKKVLGLFRANSRRGSMFNSEKSSFFSSNSSSSAPKRGSIFNMDFRHNNAAKNQEGQAKPEKPEKPQKRGSVTRMILGSPTSGPSALQRMLSPDTANRATAPTSPLSSTDGADHDTGRRESCRFGFRDDHGLCGDHGRDGILDGLGRDPSLGPQRTCQCKHHLSKRVPGLYQALLLSADATDTYDMEGVLGPKRSGLVDIEKDVTRTAKCRDVERLRNVLRCLSLYHHTVGYVQGQNFVCRFLLDIVGSEEDSFWLFSTITYHWAMRKLFGKGMPLLRLRLYQLNRLIGWHIPDLSDHLTNLGVSSDLFATAWFVTLISSGSLLPRDQAAIVWDSFFVFSGSPSKQWGVLFCLLLELLYQAKDSVLSFEEFDMVAYELSHLSLETAAPGKDVVTLLRSGKERFEGGMSMSAQINLLYDEWEVDDRAHMELHQHPLGK
ncbi:unnamed protein product [Chrysoparadoxa australica]